jgi:hypothetical protein
MDIEELDEGDTVDPADLVAELDDEPADDMADDDYDDDDLEVFRGAVAGGPWDGLTAESRYPRGFLLVDMDKQLVWIYDRRDDGSFKVRDNNPVQILDDGPDNRWRAADEEDYDILVPDIEMGGDE